MAEWSAPLVSELKGHGSSLCLTDSNQVENEEEEQQRPEVVGDAAVSQRQVGEISGREQTLIFSDPRS